MFSLCGPFSTVSLALHSMISNIHTLREKNPPDFLEGFKEEGWYINEGDLCYDVEANDCEFTIIFEGKSALSERDKLILGRLLEKIVELDLQIANKTKPYKDYEFEISYITIGDSVLFSYCGINVNSTWESEFIVEGGNSCIFKSIF